MERNEPSTEEIVRNFRGAHIFGITQALENRIADRLESLQRTVAEKDAQIEAQGKEMVRRDTIIKELTARAEKAERERDAAVNALTLYEDALFDECDKSYQSGFMDGFQSREEIDDED